MELSSVLQAAPSPTTVASPRHPPRLAAAHRLQSLASVTVPMLSGGGILLLVHIWPCHSFAKNPSDFCAQAEIQTALPGALGPSCLPSRTFHVPPRSPAPQPLQASTLQPYPEAVLLPKPTRSSCLERFNVCSLFAKKPLCLVYVSSPPKTRLRGGSSSL